MFTQKFAKQNNKDGLNQSIRDPNMSTVSGLERSRRDRALGGERNNVYHTIFRQATPNERESVRKAEMDTSMFEQRDATPTRKQGDQSKVKLFMHGLVDHQVAYKRQPQHRAMQRAAFANNQELEQKTQENVELRKKVDQLETKEIFY